MKYKYTLLVISLFTIALYSCSKGSKTPAPTASSLIVGKWYVNKISAQLYLNNVLSQTQSTTNFTTNDFIKFNSDGTGTYSENDAADGTVISLDVNYKLSNNVLYLAFPDNGSAEKDTVSVTTLTSTNLTWHSESTETVSGVSQKVTQDTYLNK